MQYVDLCVCVKVISWCLHWIKADQRKEISFNRPDFVCFSPSVLLYSRSLYLADFFLSLSNASLVRRFPSFAYLLRPADSRYYSIAISLARPAFFRKTISLPPEWGNRPNADAAGAKLSRRRDRPSSLWLGTSATFAIGNFATSMKLIVHVGRLLRNVDV